MTLMSLPNELHMQIAKFVVAKEELHNALHGITGSCLRFNQIYTPYQFTNPHIVTKDGCDTKLHRFAQAIERYKEMGPLVKILTIKIVGQGTWSATPSWKITANTALSQLGPKFQDTMWSRWLALGSMHQVLALVLLRVPNMRKFVFTVDAETHEFTSYGMFMDLKLQDFFHSLPRCRYVLSDQWLHPIQMDLLRPAHAGFIVSSFQSPLPPLVRKFPGGPFPCGNITTMIIHLHINLLTQTPDPREFEIRTYLGHILKHCHQLKAFKAMLHNHGNFPYKPLFCPDLESLKRIFRPVVPSDSLELLDISVDNLSPEYISRMESFRSLMRFRGLKILKVPQAALTVLRLTWDPAFRVVTILGNIEELIIIHANAYVYQIGLVIHHHKSALPKLKKLEIRYRDSFHSSNDIFDVWIMLSRKGVQVIRRTQDSKQAQQIINGEIVK